MKRLLQLVLIFASLAWCVSVHAQTPPTINSYNEVASWTTTGSSKATSSMTWGAGDLIACLSGSESAGSNLGLPTATGLTFANVKHNTVASTAESRLDTATAGSGGTSTITIANAAGLAFGIGCWDITAATTTGAGNSVEQHTTTRGVNLTLVQTHSAVIYATFDFAAAVTGTVIPTATHARQKVQLASHYTVYVSDLADQTVSPDCYGVSACATASGGPWSTIAFEIKGTASAGTASGFDKRRRYEEADE